MRLSLRRYEPVQVHGFGACHLSDAAPAARTPERSKSIAATARPRVRGRGRGRSVRGASTITQQVAKNLFLWRGRSLVRKGIEAWFTLLIEVLWPKRRILEVYLNVAEFGDGIYGVGAAAERFFGKPPSQLTVSEAALLAAVLPAPERRRVEQPSPHVLARARWIERQMALLGGRAYLDQR